MEKHTVWKSKINAYWCYFRFTKFIILKTVHLLPSTPTSLSLFHPLSLSLWILAVRLEAGCCLPVRPHRTPTTLIRPTTDKHTHTRASHKHSHTWISMESEQIFKSLLRTCWRCMQFCACVAKHQRKSTPEIFYVWILIETLSLWQFYFAQITKTMSPMTCYLFVIWQFMAKT